MRSSNDRLCHRRPGRAARGLLVLLLAAAVVAGVPLPAQAHRDGCHRWHSCPSDSGSYICGDLGYYSECPGGGPGSTSGSGGSGAAADPEPLDLDPPARPKVGKAVSSAGGRVQITVKAERGARLEVRDESGEPVAKATATGSEQRLAFKAADGRQAYTVYATDAADNESEASAEVDLDVDATAPAAGTFQVSAVDPVTGITAVALGSEPGVRYELTLSDREERFTGTMDGSGSIGSPVTLRLPDGAYTAKLILRDAVGNASTTTRAFKVALTRLTPAVRRSSAVNASPVVYSVTGPARSRGTLTVPGQPAAAFTTDGGGRAQVSLRLPEGRVAPATAELADRFGRRGTAVAPAFTLDTSAPALAVRSDAERAPYGDLVLTVSAERGARVAVAVTGDRAQVEALRDSWAAGAGPRVLRRQLGRGTYTFEVTAVDAAGNTTRRSISVGIGDRLTTGETVAAAVLLLLALALLFLAVWGVLRLRRSLAVRSARRREEQAALAAALAAERAEQERARALREHRERVLAYERADQEWSEREGALVELYEEAQHYRGRVLADPAWGKPRKDERVLIVADGDLMEERPLRGSTHLVAEGSGTVVVTSHRLLFIGARKREWDYDKLVGVEHVGTDTTIARTTSRQRRSGVRFGEETERARLMFDLGVADAKGSRSNVEDRVRDQLARHRASRPQPPVPPAEHRPAPARPGV